MRFVTILLIFYALPVGKPNGFGARFASCAHWGDGGKLRMHWQFNFALGLNLALEIWKA